MLAVIAGWMVPGRGQRRIGRGPERPLVRGKLWGDRSYQCPLDLADDVRYWPRPHRKRAP
jgi:hypothetical protein